jgi:hypothetical protein
MSSENYNRYKETHSEYLSRFVDLHNYHQEFLDFPSYLKGARVRKAISDMIILERKLRKLSSAVTSEHKKNVKAGHLAEKREKARLRAIPKKRGRPKVKGIEAKKRGPGRPRKDKHGNNTTN